MTDRELMAEAAILYYEKKMTQQEIADTLYLSRQTVSKLLNEAISNNIVEITVHHPKKECSMLAAQIETVFGIKNAVVASVSSRNDSMKMMLTVKAAVEHLSPYLERGGQNIAVSWGRTVQAFISELPSFHTKGNTVFPLFGATDNESSYFSSNELARSMADKIDATVKYAWFPYLPDTEKDMELLKKTSYYQKLCGLWDNIDVAIVGIGNRGMTDLFVRTFGHREKHDQAVGDIATHFFTADGRLLKLYQNTLCASVNNLRKAKSTVAIACGCDKTASIIGALKAKLIDVLITDEHTAKDILQNQRGVNL